MPLFATIERDSTEAVKLVTLAHLAADFKEKRHSEPHKALTVLMIGYFTATAASDSVKEEIERDLMTRSISALTRTLIEMGVPPDKLYVGEIVFSQSKGRKVDLFLLQQGETRQPVPANPSGSGHHIPTVNVPKPVRDSEVSVNSNKELVLEITAHTIKAGKRTLVPEISFKTNTGISPVAISKEFKSELTVWRPKLEGLLRKIGQSGNADKIEFALKIKGGAKLSKEFASQISTEIAASLQAVLTFDVTIPGTKKELPIELSYSIGGGYKVHGDAYKDGTVAGESQGMVKVTLFRFK